MMVSDPPLCVNEVKRKYTYPFTELVSDNYVS